MNPDDTPIIPLLETERLLIRAFDPQDVNDFYEQIGSDPDVLRYLRGGQPVQREDLELIILHRLQYWHQHGYGIWAVARKADNVFIGQCGLHQLDDTPEVEVAYAFGKAHWGMGYATEAGLAALRYGFEELGLPRIVAVAVPENTASLRVMVKLGMTYEKDIFVYGMSMPYYAIDRIDFRPREGEYQLIRQPSLKK